MKNLCRICLVILLLLGLHACKKKETTESAAQNYSEYISTYPEKLISVTPNLKFYLQKPVDVKTEADKAISIKPSVKGTVSLFDNAILFVPEEKLEANKEYEITLHLSALYNDMPNDLEDFRIKVKTKELLYSIVKITKGL